MGYRVYFRADDTQYDSLKHSLVLDDVWQDRSSATVTVRNVSSIASGMPVEVCCNTVSSVTFGGAVRGWSRNMTRASNVVRYDVDLDDWQTFFDRSRFCRAYSSVAINSVAMDLVATYAPEFSTTGIHSMMSQAGSLTWTKVTVAYHHNATLSEALTSLVAMAAPPDANDPPVWGLGPDKIVRLVGAGNSYGTTVVVDDSDLDLRAIEIGEIGNSICTRVYIWGGSATVVTSLAAGASSLRTYHTEAFWGPPSFLSYPISSLYVANGAELLPVVNCQTVTGDGYVTVSSLNIDGQPHGGAAMNSIVRAVLVYTTPDITTNITSAVTGVGGIFATHFDYAVQGWPENPILLDSIAANQVVPPGEELSLLRITTTNSQVAAGGRIAVSLTAAAPRQGIYTIRRVRVAGFDRGENAVPIYDVEAGAQNRYRVNSLL